MNPDTLTKALETALKQGFEKNGKFQMEDEEGNPTHLASICEVIASAVSTEVIKHIQAYAEATSQVQVTVDKGIPVSTSGPAGTQTGVTTGPGAGTGTGTITPGAIT